MNRAHRATIFLEQAEVLSQESLPGSQFLLRLRAPECARAARPGNFAHLQCDPLQPMRRPISIMRASKGSGWVDFLYKKVGSGTERLSRHAPGNRVSCLGPIGRPFALTPERSRPLLIGGGVGMPPMIFLAERLRTERAYQPSVLLGSEVPFPFQPRPSQIVMPGYPDGAIAAMPLLDDWQIPSRLASLRGFPGCFDGYVTDLARHWLVSLTPSNRAEVGIYACGPHPMLETVARLAEEFSLPCQVSLEEFMACGVGGCAGCVVPVATPGGTTMQRVCVDGPVFEAHTVFPQDVS